MCLCPSLFAINSSESPSRAQHIHIVAVHEGVVLATEVLVSPDQLDAGDPTFAQKVVSKDCMISDLQCHALLLGSFCPVGALHDCIFTTLFCALNTDNDLQLGSQVSGGDQEVPFYLKSGPGTHAKTSLAEEGCGSAIPHNGLVIDGWSLPLLA